MSAYITFIDYSKAFDSVIHSFLMDIMQTVGFPRHITSLIVSLYKNQKATIRCNGDNCDPSILKKVSDKVVYYLPISLTSTQSTS